MPTGAEYIAIIWLVLRTQTNCGYYGLFCPHPHRYPPNLNLSTLQGFPQCTSLFDCLSAAVLVLVSLMWCALSDVPLVTHDAGSWR